MCSRYVQSVSLPTISHSTHAVTASSDTIKVKRKGITFIQRHKQQLQLQRRCCVTDRVGIRPIGRRLSLLPRTLTYDQTAIRSPGLPFNGLHPRHPCNYSNRSLYFACILSYFGDNVNVSLVLWFALFQDGDNAGDVLSVFVAGSGYKGHVETLAPAVKQLATLEQRAQSSYLNLVYNKPFVSRR